MLPDQCSRTFWAFSRYRYCDTINRRAYALVYVRIRPYAEQRVGPRWPWSASVIGWNASAGLRWPWNFNIFELWRRQSAYTRAWSINPALYFCRRLRPAHTRIRRLSPSKFKHVELSRPAQTCAGIPANHESAPRSPRADALFCIATYADVYRRIRSRV